MKVFKDDLPHIGRLARHPYFAMMVEGHKRLVEAGFEALDASYSIVFQFIGEGSRITDIANRGQTSKQNIKYLVDVLEKKGYVRRKADKNDKRSYIYYLSEKGTNYRKAGLFINNRIENEWAIKLGKAKMDKLKSLLWELGKVIEEANHY